MADRNFASSSTNEKRTTFQSLDTVSVDNYSPSVTNTRGSAQKVAEDIVSESLASEPLPSIGNQIQGYHQQDHSAGGDTKHLTGKENSKSIGLNLTKPLSTSPSTINIDVRKCLIMATNRHEKLLEIVAKSDRVIAKLINDQELRLPSGVNTSSLKEAAKSCIDVQTTSDAPCVMSDSTSVLDPSNSRGDAKTMIMSRILYLEEWKAKAMSIIESQLKSLDTTVSKTSYVAALNELDSLRLGNTLLIDKLTSAHVTLLKYREIIKSVGCNVNTNETTQENERIIETNARIEALSVSISVFFPIV